MTDRSRRWFGIFAPPKPRGLGPRPHRKKGGVLLNEEVPARPLDPERAPAGSPESSPADERLVDESPREGPAAGLEGFEEPRADNVPDADAALDQRAAAMDRQAPPALDEDWIRAKTKRMRAFSG